MTIAGPAVAESGFYKPPGCEDKCTAAKGTLKVAACAKPEHDGGFSCSGALSGKYFNCCIPDAGTCLASGGTCLDPGACLTPDKSTETGFKYKIDSSATCDPATQWCCIALPARPGYVPETYDDTACLAADGLCAIGCKPTEEKISSCGVKGADTFDCCKEKTALTPTESAAAAASKSAAGSVEASKTGGTAAGGGGAVGAGAAGGLAAANAYTYKPPISGTLPSIIGNLIKRLLPLTGALLLAIFIWGGALYITAGGEEKRVNKAKSVLASALIGMLIIVGAYVIVSNIVTALGGALTGAYNPSTGPACSQKGEHCISGTACASGEVEVLSENCGAGKICCGK